MKRKLCSCSCSCSIFAYCFASMFVLLGLSACGPQGAAPGVPEAYEEYSQGTGDLETEGPNTPSGEVNPKGESPTKASPTDGLKATRLQGLPSSLASEIEDCEKQGRFFSLGDKVCTKEVTSSFPCRIDDAFLRLIDDTTSSKLQTYLTDQVRNLQLYGCTDTEKNITLHFFRFAQNTITYRKLNLPKALKALAEKD